MLTRGWEGGGGGGAGPPPPPPPPRPPDRPQDLPLELTEVYIIKAVFVCVPEHWKGITEKPNGSFFNILVMPNGLQVKSSQNWNHCNNCYL